jgi:hypothetical protein
MCASDGSAGDLSVIIVDHSDHIRGQMFDRIADIVMDEHASIRDLRVHGARCKQEKGDKACLLLLALPYTSVCLGDFVRLLTTSRCDQVSRPMD